MVVINQITNFRFGNSFFLGTIDNLNTIANVIPGIGAANKALVLDANNSINNINNISCSSITFGGTNKSVTSWLTTGIQFNTIPTTYTITDTLASTTVASAVIRSFGGSSTISATNTNITITNAASLYISGTPIAGTNVTITNNYSLWIASGGILFGSNIASTSTTTGTLVITGGLGVSGSLYATSLSGTLLIAAQPNITSVGTLTGLTMGGVLAMGTNNITGTGNIGGTLTTVAQPNITSVGDLTDLTVNGISILNGSTGINKISTPGMQAEINSATGSCLRLSYNAPSSAATVYTDLKVSSVGNLKIATSGPSVLIGNTTNIVMPLELGTTTYTIPTSFGWLKSNGTIGSSASGTSTTYSLRANGRILCNTEIDVLSDARVKTNITSLDADFCKQFIINTVPVSYNFTHVEDEKTHYGYLAQDIIRAGYDQLVSIVPNETLQEVIDSDGFVSPAGKQLTLCYDEIIPILAKNISILYEENNQLKEQINTLMKLIKNKIE